MTQCATHPLFLFLAVWGTATAFYLGGVRTHLFAGDVPGVTWAVFLNVTAFSLGYLTWSVLACPRTPWLEAPYPPGIPLTARRLRISLLICLASGLLAIGFCILRLAFLSQRCQFGLSYLITHPILCRQALIEVVTPDMYGIRLCFIAITLTSGILSAGFVLLGVLLYFGHGLRRYGVVVLLVLVSLSIALLSLGRQEFTINILFLVLSYLFLHHVYRRRRPWAALRPLVVPAVALAVLFVAIEVLLHKSQVFGRQGRLEGFLFSLYWYIASPMAAFAQYLHRAEHTLTLGQSLFFPIYKWLARAHLVPEVTKTVLTDWLFIPYPANVYTYLRDIHEDFGFAGLIVVPHVLGAFAAVLRRRAEEFFPYLNLYLALLILLIFSAYNYLLVSNQFYVQAVFVLLFFRFRLPGLDQLQAHDSVPSHRSYRYSQ